jgi:hypothetical protein
VLLANPERDWSAPPATIARAEVERRIGVTRAPLVVLSGGRRNVNVRVGDDRVLRIYRQPWPEPWRRSPIAKEAALLSRPWRALRTPAVLATGDDFLLLEHVEHGPLPASRDHGAAVGRALAEIHAIEYPLTGMLDGELALARPFPDDGRGFTLRGYGLAQLADAAPLLDGELTERVRAFLDERQEAVTAALGPPVLSHCDFKVANVHWTARDELLVLDWEFAWAGAALVDVGLIMRWQPPAGFVRGFESAYRAGGGVLAHDWQAQAEAIDLCSLLGLLARHADERSRAGVKGRIVQIVGGGRG